MIFGNIEEYFNWSLFLWVCFFLCYMYFQSTQWRQITVAVMLSHVNCNIEEEEKKACDIIIFVLQTCSCFLVFENRTLQQIKKQIYLSPLRAIWFVFAEGVIKSLRPIRATGKEVMYNRYVLHLIPTLQVTLTFLSFKIQAWFKYPIMFMEFRIWESAVCHCSTSPKTVEHFLQDCQTHRNQRAKTWPADTPVREKIYGPVENLQHTAAYVRATEVPVWANDEEEEYPIKLHFEYFLIVPCQYHKSDTINLRPLSWELVTYSYCLLSAGKKRKGTVVAASAPREQLGLYWGYQVRLARSLGEVFVDCPYEEGYDLTIGTSERGDPVEALEIPTFQ